MNCTMNDVREKVLGPPNDTTLAAVKANKNFKINSFKSGKNIKPEDQRSPDNLS